MSFIPRLALVLALLLLTPGAAHADLWSGFGSDWFASSSWASADSGPPTITEAASFPDSFFGFPFAVTNVQLSASTAIRELSVDSPVTKQWTLTGANGATLTATSAMEFMNTDRQALNVHTVTNLRLNTPQVRVRDNAILSLNNSTVTTNSIGTGASDGRIDVNNGSSVQTLTYFFDQPAGEMRVNSGGELRIAGDTTLARGLTRINAGGELNAQSGVDLEYNGAARLEFADSHAVDDGVHLKATGGGGITAGSFIDVGNNAVGSLTVDGAGSTFTSAGSTRSDWGSGSAGNATVTISNSGVAHASSLVAGISNGTFVGNVTSGGTLQTTSTFRMGGGSTNRQVSLTVDGGTFEPFLATFDNLADLNLVNGTINFTAGATFNAGSRFDWSGGVVNLGATATLSVDGGIVNRTSTAGFIFSDNSSTQVRTGGSLTTPSYFDLGNAALSVNNGTLTVGTAGGTISDWAQSSSTTTTATLSNNGVATYRSGLRMSQNGGTTSATVSSGARLVANGSLAAGGATTSVVTLDVSGGRVESDGTISLLRGATTTVSSAGVIDGLTVVLGSSGGTTTTTVSGGNSLLKARDELVAGRAGTSTLTVSAGAKVESASLTTIGELAGANATVRVIGGGSRLDVGGNLIVGAAGAALLDVPSLSSVVRVVGSVSVGSQGRMSLASGGVIETNVGQSITNAGVVEAFSGGEVRAAVVNAGTLTVRNSSVTRGVTLQANSAMNVDNATVASLTHQAGADLNFELRGTSDFDNLAVTGAASLAGDFLVSLGEGFTPTLGAQFQILAASSISGAPTFDFSAASLGSGLSWLTIPSPTSLTLAVVPSSTPGDFDLDGDVDGADLLVWQRGGSPSANSPADLALWKANFGGGSQATAATLAVPEPQAWALGALACLALRRTRCQRPSGRSTTC